MNVPLLTLFIYIVSVPVVSYLPGGATLSQVLGFIAVATFLLSKITPKSGIRLPAELVLFGIFIVWSFVGGLVAVDLSHWAVRQGTLVQLWVLAVVTFNVLTADRSRHHAGFLALQGGVLLAALGATLFGLVDVDGRVQGTLGNANTYGRLLLVGLMCVLLYRRAHRVADLAVLTISLLFVTQLLQSGSRTALGGLLILAAIFVLAVAIRNRRRPVVLFFVMPVILIGTFLFASWVQSAAVWNRIENLAGFIQGEQVRENSLYTRLDLALAGISLWQDNPILGVGNDQVRHHMANYGLAETYSHNNPVEMLANFGIVGAAIYYLVYIAFTARLLITWNRSAPNSRERQYFFYLTGFWLLWVGLEVGTVNYLSKIHWILFAMFLAAAYNLAPRNGKHSHDSGAVLPDDLTSN